MGKQIENLENIKPVRIYKIGTATFRIYKVKNLYNPVWNSGVLKSITKIARRAYLRYGQVPAMDNYDKNAAIYLCRTNYSNLEEWLCLRFVPGSDRDYALDCIDQYLYNGKNIAGIIKKRLVLKNNSVNKFVAVSRLCGIPPQVVGSVNNKADLSSSMRYTAQAFTLINKEFFSEKHFSYLVGVFRPEVLKKIAHFGSGSVLSFPDAYKILNCRPGQVRLNRNRQVYRFPGYFLNVGHLVKLLKKLIKRQELNSSFVGKYAKHFTVESGKRKNYREILKMISGISTVLLWKGKMPKSKISGEQLRAMVGRLVADGPKLKIMTVSKWVKQLNKIKVKEIYG